MRTFLITAITLLSLSTVFGQASKKEIEKADNALYDEVFATAYNLYKDLSIKYPNDDSFRYHQLISYHLSEGRGTDVSELLAFQKEMGAKDEFYNYWMGRVHFVRYDFDLATDHFAAFNKINRYKSNSLLQESIYMIRWSKRAKKFYQEIDDYEIYALPSEINTIADEAAPVFFKGNNELIFFRSQGADSHTAMHALKKSDDWNKVEPITNLGNFKDSELRAEILSDGKRLVVYKNENGGDLYTSSYSSTGWATLAEYDPTLIAKIKSDFFISADEKTVLFSSRKGKQDFDIFEITKSANGWSEPQPLNINTDGYDEDFPYITDDGKTLYFSSNRPESIGGYDVFVSTKATNGNWSQPQNMGFPINTIDHELHFQMNHGSNTGYFSTNRLHSAGGLDIFYFFKIEKIETSGVVLNKETNKPVPGVLIKFHPKLYTDESIEATSDENGNYNATLIKNEEFIVEFNINREKLDEQSINVSESTTSLNFTIAVKDSIPEKVDFASLYKGDTTEINEEAQISLPTMNPVYFETESSELNSSDKSTLSNLAKGLKIAKGIKVQLNGYTDNTGSEAYNKRLSTKRAKAVADFLISKGVMKSQISTEGFGENNPVATNETDSGKAKNRRVELQFSK
jgi:outer membrane protein OmpA-like peptidoglycan-associated protein